jgi:tRNA(fMet)-specific endonuclease VapC
MPGRLYMLDTNICSFIMRSRPAAVLDRLEQCVEAGDIITVSAITYAELRFGATSSKASPKHSKLVDAFVQRLDGILPWDAAAVDATARLRAVLAAKGTPIGENDAAIAGNALAVGAVLVTYNTREFDRVAGLTIEDWV